MLTGLSRPSQWVLLALLSPVFAVGLQAAGMPAAFLLGPMIVAVAFGANGADIRVPRPLYRVAQAIIACLICSSLTPEVFDEVARDGFLFLGVTIALIVVSAALGTLITNLGVLPGSTALWGCWPGGSSVMVILAEANGADARLVAFMQYLRVILVSLAAAGVAYVWIDSAHPLPANGRDWLAPVHWLDLLATLGLVLASIAVGLRLRIPGGSFLVTLFVGLTLQTFGWIRFELPMWLTVASFVALGWFIGLGFTRATLLHAWKVLPQVLLSILALMAFAGGLAYIVHRFAGVDMLTAYLATSPGGLDTVAVIAASAPQTDIAFVLTMQIIRLFAMILVGPYLARFLLNRRKAPEEPPETPLD